jgi:hypothetical protein
VTRLGDVSDLAIAPDGRHLYVASFSTIWTFRRDRVSGALRRVPGRAGCVRQWGRPGCGRAHGLGGIESILVSPDGRHVYAAARGSRSIAAFRRHPVSGRLTQLRGRLGCVSRFPSPCSRGGARGLLAPRRLAISRDGRNVYAASTVFIGSREAKSALAVFTRNRRSGSLRQPGGPRSCVTSRRAPVCTVARGLEGAGSVAVSYDGKTLYAGSLTNAAVTVFRRGRSGRIAQLAGPAGCVARRSSARFRRRFGCGGARLLGDVETLLPSADGKSLYVFSDQAERLLIFRRHDGGRLSQPRGAGACIEYGNFIPCRQARGFFEPGEPVLSPDGRNVYTSTSSGWAAFRRLPTGDLRQPHGKLGCGLDEEDIRDVFEGDEGCRHNKLPFLDLDSTPQVVASADGRHVYFGAPFSLFAFRRL